MKRGTLLPSRKFHVEIFMRMSSKPNWSKYQINPRKCYHKENKSYGVFAKPYIMSIALNF